MNILQRVKIERDRLIADWSAADDPGNWSPFERAFGRVADPNHRAYLRLTGRRVNLLNDIIEAGHKLVAENTSDGRRVKFVEVHGELSAEHRASIETELDDYHVRDRVLEQAEREFRKTAPPAQPPQPQQSQIVVDDELFARIQTARFDAKYGRGVAQFTIARPLQRAFNSAIDEGRRDDAVIIKRAAGELGWELQEHAPVMTAAQRQQQADERAEEEERQLRLKLGSAAWKRRRAAEEVQHA